MIDNQTAHSKYPEKVESISELERRRGLEAARILLAPIYAQPDVRSKRNPHGIESAADQLLAAGKAAKIARKPYQSSLLTTVGSVPEFAEAQQRLDIARADARTEDMRYGHALPETKRAIRASRELALGFNGSLKNYQDLHSDQSLEYISSLLAGSYTTMMKAEGHTPRVGKEVYGEIYNTARGMRGELAAEQILGNFENVEIQYHLADDEKVRRWLDAKGTDYKISVTVYDNTFDLAVDIKVNETSTVDEYGDPLPGKLWNQCRDSDFVNNTSRIDNERIGYKAIPMQAALINQICLQHPGELEKLAEAHGETLDDIYID